MHQNGRGWAYKQAKSFLSQKSKTIILTTREFVFTVSSFYPGFHTAFQNQSLFLKWSEPTASRDPSSWSIPGCHFGFKNLSGGSGLYSSFSKSEKQNLAPCRRLFGRWIFYKRQTAAAYRFIPGGVKRFSNLRKRLNRQFKRLHIFWKAVQRLLNRKLVVASFQI